MTSLIRGTLRRRFWVSADCLKEDKVEYLDPNSITFHDMIMINNKIINKSKQIERDEFLKKNRRDSMFGFNEENMYLGIIDEKMDFIEEWVEDKMNSK